jgi:hypothetical protein
VNRRALTVTLVLAAAAAAAAAGTGQFLFGYPWERTYDARLEGFARGQDPREIVLQIDVFSTARILRETVSETPEVVTITVVAARPADTFDYGSLRRSSITLRGPLGNRPVIDGSRGVAVDELPFVPTPP